ncbi:MAG: CDP-alcohol phosphatidyltransferase family protein [Patescibacteria group bacterium]
MDPLAIGLHSVIHHVSQRSAAAVQAGLHRIPSWITPNRLSGFRMCLGLPVFLLFRDGDFAWGSAVFTVAMFFDFLDGALARLRGQITNLGKFLDPLADKVVVAAALFGLAPWVSIVPYSIVVWINIGMALALTGVRIVKWTKGMDFAATGEGKLKLILELAMLAGLAFGVWLNVGPLLWAGYILLCVMPYFAGKSLVSQIQPLLADEPR